MPVAWYPRRAKICAEVSTMAWRRISQFGLRRLRSPVAVWVTPRGYCGWGDWSVHTFGCDRCADDAARPELVRRARPPRDQPPRCRDDRVQRRVHVVRRDGGASDRA